MRIQMNDSNSSNSGGGTFDDRPRREYTPAPHNSVFEAEVVEVKEEESRFKNDDGSTKMELTFKFRVLDDGEFNDRWFWGRTNTWLSNDPRNKLRQYVQSILDEDVLPSGFVLDTDDLVGQPCRIVVHAKEKADGSGRIVNWVQEVRPSRNRHAAIQASAPRPGSSSVPDDLEPF